MKKIILLSLTFLSVIGLTACGGGKELSADEAKGVIETAVQETAKKGKYKIELNESLNAKADITMKMGAQKQTISPKITMTATMNESFDGTNLYQKNNITSTIDGLGMLAMLIDTNEMGLNGVNEIYEIKDNDTYTSYLLEDGVLVGKYIEDASDFESEGILVDSSNVNFKIDDEDIAFMDLSKISKSGNKLTAGNDIVKMDELLDMISEEMELPASSTLSSDDINFDIKKFEVILNKDNSIKSFDIEASAKIKTSTKMEGTDMDIDASGSIKLSGNISYDNVTVTLPDEVKNAKVVRKLEEIENMLNDIIYAAYSVLYKGESDKIVKNDGIYKINSKDLVLIGEIDEDPSDNGFTIILDTDSYDISIIEKQVVCGNYKFTFDSYKMEFKLVK